MTEWLKDDNGNRASVTYFGSRKAAQKALDSLKDCEDCVNCERCERCIGCVGCEGCRGCTGLMEAANRDMSKKSSRWVVTVYYHTDDGLKAVVLNIEELHELHEIIESGPNWYSIRDIRIELADPMRMTIEQSLDE